MISPCIGVCVLDRTGSLCRGCGRTIGEIAGWLSMSESERRRTIERAARRRARSAAAMSGSEGPEDKGPKDYG
jgi:predicted Fe-S protein YdhL (DUF1289 family)